MKWILQLNPTFPKIVKVSEEMQDLISKCLQKEPFERIGFEDTSLIKKHPWFADVDWSKIEKLEIEPPIKLDLKDKADTENFCEEALQKKAEIENLKEID